MLKVSRRVASSFAASKPPNTGGRNYGRREPGSGARIVVCLFVVIGTKCHPIGCNLRVYRHG